jgi:release factor glutamine methyltransferase
MTIQEASQYLISQLQSVYDASEASNIAVWVLESITNFNRLAQKIHSSEVLDVNQAQKMESYIRELLNHRPVQYVLGECYFMDMKLFVDENVLVPRPETEELVDWVIKYCQSQGRDAISILDIGTGSGCIALALKKHIPKSKVTAMDISAGALDVARRNAKALGLEISFMQNNILNEKEWGDLSAFDIIVSNPPYITLPEQESILPNVLSYEPHQALFVTDEDPQQFYKAIEAFSRQKLQEGGLVFMELHRDFAKDTQAYYEHKGWQTILRKDMQENDRMLMAQKKR